MAQLVKNPATMQETWVWSLGWEDPREREQLTTLAFWPGEFHGPYSPWGHKESDMTKCFHFTSFSSIAWWLLLQWLCHLWIRFSSLFLIMYELTNKYCFFKAFMGDLLPPTIAHSIWEKLWFVFSLVGIWHLHPWNFHPQLVDLSSKVT